MGLVIGRFRLPVVMLSALHYLNLLGLSLDHRYILWTLTPLPNVFSPWVGRRWLIPFAVVGRAEVPVY